jgi:hypothetical protein
MNHVWAVLAAGLGLVAFWAARSQHRTRARVLGWPSVPGRVTAREVIRATDRGRTSQAAFRFAPDVRYVYAVDGAQHEGDRIVLPWTATGSKRWAEKELARIPDAVAVRYDPDAPATSCLYPPGRKNVAMYVAGGVLCLFIALLFAV